MRTPLPTPPKTICAILIGLPAQGYSYILLLPTFIPEFIHIKCNAYFLPFTVSNNLRSDEVDIFIIVSGESHFQFTVNKNDHYCPAGFTVGTQQHLRGF